MHPLDALGLDREADERAVKRAYAQRLKTARPDEDPQGFQALHETYQAALAYLRWRAAHPDGSNLDDDDEEIDDGGDRPDAVSVALTAEEFEQLIGGPRWAPPPPEPRSPPEEAPAQEPFSLDLPAFLDRLFHEAETHDAARLRAWLARETAGWPLDVKPAVAPRIMERLIGEAPDITPAQLEAIVEAFGLDDVLTAVDPIGLQRLRERLAAKDDFRQRSRKLDYLWRAGNRRELTRYMRQPERGGYLPPVTRLIAYWLTSGRAYEWAFFLRPVPFVTRIVTGFLRHLDGGHLDALPAGVDALAVDFWEWAEMRRERNRRVRYALVIIGLLCGLSVLSSKPPPGPSPGGVAPPASVLRSRPIQGPTQRERDALERVRRIIALDDAQNAEAVEQYEAVIRDHEPPWTEPLERAVAVSYYNKGVALQRLQRYDEARTTYVQLDDLFSSVRGKVVALVVAKGLVNLGGLQNAARDFQAAVVTLQKVLARHEFSRDADFEVQVARAFVGRAEAFAALGRREEALHAADETLRRFSERTEEPFGNLLSRARRVKERFG